MQPLIPFDFQDHLVRVVTRGDDPWFVAGDVAAVLGYRDAGNMVRNLDDDEKDTHNVSTLGGEQAVTILSESGLYAVILRSRRAEARQFRKWVTAEVLPSLRRTGRYAVAGAEPAAEPLAFVPAFDPGALTAAISAVREARRLKGAGAALHLWRTLGLPSLDPVAESDFTRALARAIGDADEVTSGDLMLALALDPDDFSQRRRVTTALADMGFARAVVRRPVSHGGTRPVRVWRRVDGGQANG